MLCVRPELTKITSGAASHLQTAGDFYFEIFLIKAGGYSLSSLTQQAACNQGILLPKYLFRPFWGDGNWFYKYVMEAAQLQITSGTNDTGACPLKKSDADVAETKTLATVGGVLGGVILILLGALTWCGYQLFQLRRENERRELAPEPFAPSPLFHAQQQPAITYGQYSRKSHTILARQLKPDMRAAVETQSPIPSPQQVSPIIPQPQPQQQSQPQPRSQSQPQPQYINSRPIKPAYPAPPNLQDHAPGPLEYASRVAGPQPS
ncbi:hypothetical protein FRC07_012997, partial [Ceratobasidium sp. 392]